MTLATDTDVFGTMPSLNTPPSGHSFQVFDRRDAASHLLKSRGMDLDPGYQSLAFTITGVGFIVLNISVFACLKMYWHRRRGQGPPPSDAVLAVRQLMGQPPPLMTYYHAELFLPDNPPEVARSREARVITQQNLDEQFPVQRYSAWLSSGIDKSCERQPTNDLPEDDTPSALSKPVVNRTITPDNEESGLRPSEGSQTDLTELAELSACHKVPSNSCAICLDPINIDHGIRALTCNHIFHSECITPWLTTRCANCPLCKMEIPIISEPTAVHFCTRNGQGSTTSPQTTPGNVTLPWEMAVASDNLEPQLPPRRVPFYRSFWPFNRFRRGELSREEPIALSSAAVSWRAVAEYEASMLRSSARTASSTRANESLPIARIEEEPTTQTNTPVPMTEVPRQRRAALPASNMPRGRWFWRNWRRRSSNANAA